MTDYIKKISILMNSLDFTFQKYSQILKSLVKNNYKVYTIYDYYINDYANTLKNKFIILRHDVDGNVPNALKMAELEHSLGITATYYIRMKGNLFVPEVVKRISDLGHEIGYHYEHIPDAKGDIEKSKIIFEENLKKLRNITNIYTVCMHGRPFSKYDSRDFWNHYKLGDYGLIAEPYLNIDYTNKYYFTDTGQAWDNYKFNLRDIVNSQGSLGIESSSDLIKLINNSEFNKAAFLIHTNRWVDELSMWLFYTVGNSIVNKLKQLLKQFRK